MRVVINLQRIAGRGLSLQQWKTPQDSPCNPRSWTCERRTDRTPHARMSPPGPTRHSGWFPAYLKEEIVKNKNTPSHQVVMKIVELQARSVH